MTPDPKTGTAGSFGTDPASQAFIADPEGTEDPASARERFHAQAWYDELDRERMGEEKQPPLPASDLERLRARFRERYGEDPTLYTETAWGLPRPPIVPVQVPPDPKGRREVHVIITVPADTEEQAKGRAYALLGKPHPRFNDWRFAERRPTDV